MRTGSSRSPGEQDGRLRQVRVGTTLRRQDDRRSAGPSREGRREFLETGALRAPPFPDFYEQVVTSGVGDGESGELLANLPAGTYAVMCMPDDVPMWEVDRAAQLNVIG
jgi:hypothetical protein